MVNGAQTIHGGCSGWLIGMSFPNIYVYQPIHLTTSHRSVSFVFKRIAPVNAVVNIAARLSSYGTLERPNGELGGFWCISGIHTGNLDSMSAVTE